MDDNVVQFPVRAPVELELVTALKELTCAFCGRITIAQVLGCFSIAADEIKQEQTE